MRERGVPRGTAGITLLETMLGMTFFAVAALSTMSVMVYSARLDAANRETAVATQAARREMEKLKATDFEQVYATFNTDPNDDPAGNGTSPGDEFTVDNLQEASDEVTAAAGSISFPVAANGSVNETLIAPELGLPRDLDLDGKNSVNVPVADVRALPVTVTVRWTGVGGEREVKLFTVLRP